MNISELGSKYMLNRLCGVSLAAVICLGSSWQFPAQSKTTRVDEGQAKLMREVNAGQKSKQLTVKEASKLRKELAQAARKKAKMLAKADRKLSIDETAELKSDVNKISDKMHKLELEKQSRPD